MTVGRPQDDQPILNIHGQQVALGPLRRDLLPTYQRWINDFEVTRTIGTRVGPMTTEAESSWLEGRLAPPLDPIFTIYERATLRPIGTADLRNIDYISGTAEFGILIGEKDCWGKGYGGEATSLMLDYAFNALGLHSVLLQVQATNERGIRAYRRAGFREIGRRHEAVKRGGQRCDLLLMECLATEFESPLLGRLLDVTAPPGRASGDSS